MTSTEKRIFIPLLKRVLNDTINHGTKSTARYWLHRLQKPRSKPSAQRKEAKAAQHGEETDAIRAAVRERAGGVCEACGHRWGFWGWSLDHWLGGWGRRRQKQSVETCWALCGTGTTGCHGKRTTNDPGAAAWNEMFRRHCEKHGYRFQPHITHEPVPRKSA